MDIIVNQELTPEEEQLIHNWIDKNLMPEQDENGIDLGYLRENLKLTPWERLCRHQKLRESRRWIKNARISGPL
jgi:hypothetical protein